MAWDQFDISKINNSIIIIKVEHKYGVTSAMSLKLLSDNIYKIWFTDKYIYVHLCLC